MPAMYKRRGGRTLVTFSGEPMCDPSHNTPRLTKRHFDLLTDPLVVPVEIPRPIPTNHRREGEAMLAIGAAVQAAQFNPIYHAFHCPQSRLAMARRINQRRIENADA